MVILALIAVAGFGVAWSNSASIDTARQAVADQVKSMEQSAQQDITAVKDRLATTEKANTDFQSDLRVVTDKLKITQGQLIKARQEAAAKNNETTEMVKNLDTSVHNELAAKATTDDVTTVDTRVTKVSADLDKTNNDLSMARSELGTLIATNHDEIQVLRRMGERDYVEFTIAGRNKPQKVGNVTVELRGVSEKRNRSSIAYTVEDKRYEARNANVNSPMFFYLSGTHLPEEIVINKIGKNSISGYLSIPKANSQSASAATASGR